MLSGQYENEPVVSFKDCQLNIQMSLESDWCRFHPPSGTHIQEWLLCFLGIVCVCALKGREKELSLI
jgi:hypothetical protein